MSNIRAHKGQGRSAKGEYTYIHKELRHLMKTLKEYTEGQQIVVVKTFF